MVNDKYGLGISKKLLRTYPGHPCDTCIAAKSKQNSIKKLTARSLRAATSTMDCWNADLIGPFSTVVNNERIHLPSYNGYNYALVVVDEWSRYVMVIPLKKKSDATQEVIDLITLKENSSNKKLKRFHCDGAKDFNNEILLSYFKEHGIELTTTTPYTSLHNPIVERMNQTLEVLTRCLLNYANAPEEMWCDALILSAHIHNNTCQQSINGAIPHARMNSNHRIEFDIKKIHTFGCDAFIVKHEHEIGKFQSRTEPGIYIGYSKQFNAHKVLLLKSRKVVCKRSVIFKEDSFNHLQEIKLLITKQAQDHIDSSSIKDKKWEVKFIDDERVVNGILKCKVYWKGYRYPTWEDRKKLEEDCPDVINEFDKYKKSILVNAITLLTNSTSIIDYKIPKSMKEVYEHPDREKWLEAVECEIQSILKQNTTTPTYLPKNSKTLGTQWIFTVKHNEKNEIIRWKARLVVLGNHQKEGRDYFETFSPTVHIKSIKFILAVAAQEDLEIKQIDFDTAFLNAEVKEDIYLRIPQGFHHPHLKPGMVLKLNKALYGLKQAPREWWKELDGTLQSLGYHSSPLDECLYMKIINGKRIYLTLYVDDTLAVYPKELEEVWLKDKQAISNKYSIKDMGDCQWILNMAIIRDREKKIITLSQKGYLDLILSTHQMNQSTSKRVSTPFLYRDLSGIPDGIEPIILDEEEQSSYRSIVGELLYAANITRIDLSYIVSILARHVNKPYNYHMSAARRVLQYLNGRTDMKLQFTYSPANKDSKYNIILYADSSYGDDKSDRKSTSGWISMINDNPIAWQSKKQSTVAMSTTEAELYGLCEALKESLFMKQWFSYYTGSTPTIEIRGDNQGSLFISDHNTNHNRTKHIDIHYFFIREHIKNKDIILTYISTQDQLADILTKATSRIIFQRLLQRLLR